MTLDELTFAWTHIVHNHDAYAILMCDFLQAHQHLANNSFAFSVSDLDSSEMFTDCIYANELKSWHLLTNILKHLAQKLQFSFIKQSYKVDFAQNPLNAEFLTVLLQHDRLFINLFQYLAT